MSSRGKKDCPNCKKEIGARSILCKLCGYHFGEKKVRKDLLESKVKVKVKKIKKEQEPKVPTIFKEPGRGKKACPDCSTIVGAPTTICPKCNFDYKNAPKIEKVTTVNTYDSLKQGRKGCPKCSTIIGGRVMICPKCNFDYTTLPKKEKVTYVSPTYDTLTKGKKQCPKCDVIVGGRTMVCPKCNFDFIIAKEDKIAEKIAEKEVKKDKLKVQHEELGPEAQALFSLSPYAKADELSPEDHAARILGYDMNKAKNLLYLARKNKIWPHVNWDIVEAELEKKETELVEA